VVSDIAPGSDGSTLLTVQSVEDGRSARAFRSSGSITSSNPLDDATRARTADLDGGDGYNVDQRLRTDQVVLAHR
jgi:hypothetical protein